MNRERLLLALVLVSCGPTPGEGSDAGPNDASASHLDAFDDDAAVSCPMGAADPTPAAGAPVVFWASQPVRPDETIVITAGNLSSTAHVEIAAVPDCDPGAPGSSANVALDWHSVVPLYASSTGMQVVVPSAMPVGVYAIRITDHGQTSARTLVNSPDPWFVQGDAGATATPGGWLQVNGTSLGDAHSARAALVMGGHVVAMLSPDAADPDASGYRERFVVPASTPAGTYELWLHAGHGGPLGWSRFSGFITEAITTVTIAPRQMWPDLVVDVTMQAGADDDARFTAAIAALAANGGGVLLVPAGTYDLTGTLWMPMHTVLRGAGMDTTTLAWTADPPEVAYVHALVAGAPRMDDFPNRETFSVEDITIRGTDTYVGAGIVRQYSHDPAWIRRTHVVLPNLTPVFDAVNYAIFLEQVASTEITDCILDARSDLKAREAVSYLRVERNVFHWRDATLWLSGGDANVIIDHDEFAFRGDATMEGWGDNPNAGFAYTAFYGTSVGGPYTRDLYFGQNHHTSDRAQDPTGIIRTTGYTSDGAAGIYLGAFTASGTMLTLAGPTEDPGIDASNGHQITYDFAGGIAMIIDGTGVGQWRYITHATQASMTAQIDRPFDVAPDATSTINLVDLQGRSLFVGNQLDGEYTNQEYFSSLDIIRADNDFRVGGYETWCGKPYPWSTFVTPWHVQVIDNRIETLTQFWTHTEDPDPAYHGPAASAQIYRNNVFTSSDPSAFIRFTTRYGQPVIDSLIEHNVAGRMSLGASGEALDYRGMVLRGNTGALDGNLEGMDPSTVPGVVYVP